MAFTNVRRIPQGGGISLIVADFTHTVGAADQTFAVDAGRVLGVIVNPNLTAEPIDHTNTLYSTTVSGAISTITIYAESGITAGTFMAWIDNGG